MVSHIDRRREEKGRRGIPGNDAISARNTQAARDALRRRQKEKKARIVKKHVRYKQSKKLIDQLQDVPVPIVAKELSRGDSDEDNEATNRAFKPSKVRGKKRSPEQDEEKRREVPSDAISTEKGDDTIQDISSNAVEEGNDRDAPGIEETDEVDKQQDAKKRKKYLPFQKERKYFEKVKKEREAKEKEHQQKIEEREEMLRQSKKQRGKQVRLNLQAKRANARQLSRTSCLIAAK